MGKYYAITSLVFEVRYKEYVIDVNICNDIDNAHFVVDLMDCANKAIAKGFDYAGIVCKNINDICPSYIKTDDADLINKFEEVKDCVDTINMRYVIEQIRIKNE